MATQYIVKQLILYLCEEAVRRLGTRVSEKVVVTRGVIPGEIVGVGTRRVTIVKGGRGRGGRGELSH